MPQRKQHFRHYEYQLVNCGKGNDYCSQRGFYETLEYKVYTSS